MESQPNNTLYALSIASGQAVADLLEQRLFADDDQFTAWTAEEQDDVRWEAYFPDRATAEARARATEGFLRSQGVTAPWRVTVRQLPPQNWAESWKRFFHAARLSDRIWVKPSWETLTVPPDACLIELDPGLAFGTGQHATTQSCLQCVDRLSRAWPGARLLDMGCGSGILAIAAAKLGCRTTLAVDHDAAAIRVARANAGLNGVADRINYVVADLAAFACRRPFDLVIANLLANLLASQAEALAATVAPLPGRALVLSGLLAPQYPPVRDRYLALGFQEDDVLTRSGWTTACLIRS
jgi:ribosomal protein L11 methyltransferase